MRLCGTRSTVAAHGGASPPRSVSSHLNNFFDLHDNSLLSEDPEGNKVRSLHFTHLSRIHQKCLEVSRGARETWFRPDAHDGAPRAPCRTRGPSSSSSADSPNGGLIPGPSGDQFELPKETGGKASFEGWAEWAGCRESPPWDLWQNLGCVCMTMDDAMRGLRSVTHRARIGV